jgi:hypothetical protein
MNYINEVYKNICIKEDKSILRDYLYYLYIYESLSNKKLSALLNLPVPIVCAIKKEFIKFEIVKQDRGIKILIFHSKFKEPMKALLCIYY